MSGLRKRLSDLCDQLSRHGSMADQIRGAGMGAEFDELLAIVRGEAAADDAREKALLDSIEDACARDGLSPVTTRGFSDSRLPAGFGAGPDKPVAGPWTCPGGHCERVVFPDEVTGPPVCAVVGGAMTPFRSR